MPTAALLLCESVLNNPRKATSPWTTRSQFNERQSAEGAFDFGDVPPGTYLFSAKAEGVEGPTRLIFVLAPDKTADAPAPQR